jgi:hypothetical protein
MRAARTQSISPSLFPIPRRREERNEGSGVGQGDLREMQGHQAEGGHPHRVREPEAQATAGVIPMRNAEHPKGARLRNQDDRSGPFRIPKSLPAASLWQAGAIRNLG